MRPTCDNEAERQRVQCCGKPAGVGPWRAEVAVAGDVLWREFPPRLGACFSTFVPDQQPWCHLEAQTLRPLQTTEWESAAQHKAWQTVDTPCFSKPATPSQHRYEHRQITQGSGTLNSQNALRKELRMLHSHSYMLEIG